MPVCSDSLYFRGWLVWSLALDDEPFRATVRHDGVTVSRTGPSQSPSLTNGIEFLIHQLSAEPMMRIAIILIFIPLFGCASAHHWEKADSSGKIESTQDAGALRKTLDDCLANAAGKEQDLGNMFGSESTHAVFEKCMHDKGYTKS
jgi:hypothetical protein